MTDEQAKPHPCETRRLRQEAEAHPDAWKARVWRWHTHFCPEWKSYQRHRAAQDRG